MNQKMAESLENDLEYFENIFVKWISIQTDKKQVIYLRSSLNIIQSELERLRNLISGTSQISERNVYLSVSSLRKGLLEIGANFYDDNELRQLFEKITDKAYDCYKKV
jgi:hypothetical protein